MPHLGINKLNKNERPREKIKERGAAYLTDEELLAILINSGTKNKSSLDIAREILINDTNFYKLANKNFNEMTKINGIGNAKASRIQAAVEIGKRLRSPETKENVKKAKDVYEYIKKDLYGKDKEHLYLISTDLKNRIISKDLISIGTVSEALISPREVFKTALSNSASGIILVHNHPSGDPTPSQEDIDITIKIFDGTNLLGLVFLDHVVYTDKSFFSMRENNLIRKEVT